MTDTLEIAKLDACEVSGDGASIRLSVTDGQGRPLDLQVTAEQAGSLAMTLPRLVDAALKARYRDPSLRLVYPLTETASNTAYRRLLAAARQHPSWRENLLQSARRIAALKREAG